MKKTTPMLCVYKYALSLLFLILTITSVLAQPAGPMVNGIYTYTSGTVITWYDPGGSGGTTCPSVPGGGNYANNLNITETINANPGQTIIVTFTVGTVGIASVDVLTVYDGPNNTYPVLGTYTNTVSIPIPIITTSNSITFVFTSDASNTCKGWQATIASYFFMQPGNFTFTCPGGPYTFLDPQLINSQGPGGSNSCPGASTRDYQDFANLSETFFTSNGQCISVTPFFSSFGICDTDVLTIYNGPTIFSPIANNGNAIYTNTFTTPSSFSTTSNSITYQFVSTGVNHARGWQITMACTNCPSASINNDCSFATPLTPGSSCNYIPSSVSAGNTVQAGVPACVGNPNDDVWYTFVANNSTMSITVAATDGTMDPVIQLLSGTCISFTSLYCVNSTGAGGTETISATGLTIGTTYYVRVYDFTANAAAHTFNICVVGSAPTDCAGAIHVCSASNINGTFTWNSYGVQEYSFGTFGCITGGETTSAWYYWQCQTPGTLSFNLASSNGTFQDIDWALWGHMPSMSCPMTTQPLRCSYAQGFATNSYGLPAYSTGLQDMEVDFSEGAGNCGGACNAFVDTVNMKAGKYYALLMNLWGGNTNFMMTFSLTNGATINNCVLPVELTSFTGETVKNSVNLLHWRTESEINSNYFDIERSFDGKTFTSIGTIPAKGISTTLALYQFSDAKPGNGENYYRLKQVDQDGTVAYSEMIVLEIIPTGLWINVLYPNPTNGLVTVETSSTDKTDAEILISDQVGRVLYRRMQMLDGGSNTFSIDLSDFPLGIYFLTLSDSKEVSSTMKIVKSK